MKGARGWGPKTAGLGGRRELTRFSGALAREATGARFYPFARIDGAEYVPRTAIAGE